ncbi:ribosome biogenesis GTPase YqeH [Mycoplasma sp. P36-A1]|uniref:ribosome biogenesis GTPase YqeH n=1 Tax=Mycoplasma sp. P36-A1 TaxID=3252900 RepID=UPI003C2B1898
MSKKICYGCGVELQDKNKNEPGYINNLENEEHELCQRCFKMNNYNEYHSHYLQAEDFKKILKNQIKPKNLVVLIVDLFDLEASFSTELLNIIKYNPIVLVASKRDLILKSVKDKKLTTYLMKIAKEKELDIKDIVISSALKKYNVDDLMDSIFDNYHHKDVYICGITNVGKSSIVNALINSMAKTEHKITISNYPGTTLDSIAIPLDDATLYDTPGIVNNKQMIHHVSVKDYKYFTNNKEIKAMNYQLNEEQSLYIGGLARFDFLFGDKTGFSTYFNPKIKIHRTKLENADDLYNNHLEDSTLIPKALEVKKVEDFVNYRFEVKATERKVDIVISGLGWISFNTTNQIIEVKVPKGVQVTKRSALI